MNTRFKLFILCVFLVGSGLCTVFGQDLLTNSDVALILTGHYSCCYARSLASSILAITNKFNFVAMTTQTGWGIFSTNALYPEDWGKMWYDGTNIYTLVTDARDPLGRVMSHNPESNPDGIHGNVYPGEIFLKDENDTVRLSLPWISFHLPPRLALHIWSDGNGDAPLWGIRSADALSAYGYRYAATISDDGRVVQRISSVRDSKLDLPTDEMEFRREHLDYPFSEVIRKGAVETLAVRTRVPNGFTNCVFECLDVLQTNGLSIPLRTRFSCYWRDHRQEGHVRLVKYEEYSLTVEKVEILEGGTLPEIVAPGSALVYDFRYEAANGRTKYNHATYFLNSGSHFRSGNDPELISEAKNWLIHGTAYEGQKSNRTSTLVEIIVISLSATIVFLLLMRRGKSPK